MILRRLMKLCGVIELFSEIGSARDVVGRPAETIGGDVVTARVKSQMADGCQTSIFVERDGRSDRGEMEGIACRSLMTAHKKRAEECDPRRNAR
jgi:hypothetical protein